MNLRFGWKWLPAAVACLLLAGLFTPMVARDQVGPPVQGQLSALVAAADSSRFYANTAVEFAASHGLSVGSAQAEITQGDSLLATARADAQSGADVAGGIAAAQGAMSDYTSAATEVGVTLTNAGLAATVDYQAALAAVAELNETATIFTVAAGQVCGGSWAVSANASAFAHTCTSVGAQITSAQSHLSQASAILLTSSGHVSANLSQALSLVALARTELKTVQDSVLAISTFTYSQRARAYISSVVLPLSAKANATIRTENSELSNLTSFEGRYMTYSQDQSSGATAITSSAAVLAKAIGTVNTGDVSSSITAAQRTAAQVNANMSSLLSLVSSLLGTTLQIALVNAIDTCTSATSSYNSALASAGAQSNAYSGTSLSGFSSYLTTMNSDAAQVQSYGGAYATSYGSVQASLSALINAGGILPTLLAQLQADLNVLNSLQAQVASTTSGVNTSLQQETGAMASVQSDISSFSTTVSSNGPSILLSMNLLSSAASVSAEGAGYLNATALAAQAKVYTQVNATARDATSFDATSQSCLLSSIATFPSNAASLASSSATLGTQTQASVASVGTAFAYLNGDATLRVSRAAAGHADVTKALVLFSKLDVPGGATAMAAASVEFQASSSVMS